MLVQCFYALARDGSDAVFARRRCGSPADSKKRRRVAESTGFSMKPAPKSYAAFRASSRGYAVRAVARAAGNRCRTIARILETVTVGKEKVDDGDVETLLHTGK